MRYMRYAAILLLLASALAASAGPIRAEEASGGDAARQLYCQSGDTLIPLTIEECELSGLDPARYESMKSAFEDLCRSTYGNEFRVRNGADFKENPNERAAPASGAK